MGIQWWYRPQTSIHWPQKIPDTRKIITLCDEYPGTQSILIPAEGTAHEWMTSREDARICKRSSIGNATAAEACSRNILLIPLRIGRYWFLNKNWVFVLSVSPEFVNLPELLCFETVIASLINSKFGRVAISFKDVITQFWFVRIWRYKYSRLFKISANVAFS